MRLGPKIPYDPNNPEHSDEAKYKFNHGDVFIHSLRVLSNIVSNDYRLKLAALFHDIGKPSTKGLNDRGDINNHGHDKVGAFMFQAIAERLKMSNEDTEFVTELIENHMKFKEISKMKKSTLRRFISLEHFEALIKLEIADIIGSGFGPYDLSSVKFAYEAIERYGKEEKKPVLPDPLITGYDLIALGMKPSSQFKVIIDEMMDRQLEDEFEDRADALVALEGILTKKE